MKRARAAKIHAYIISHLKKEMPAIMGKAKAQQKLIDNLEDEFGKVGNWFDSADLFNTPVLIPIIFHANMCFNVVGDMKTGKESITYLKEISQMWIISGRC